VSDEHIRERALDPTESFIVQAPAGSGKTELLIRRYLTLLAHVDEPEQIVAITFTRKAAAEMRQRVAQALVDASAAEVSSQPHREATLAIARRVLERSRARGWALPDHAERLWIETVDALNARLARQLPVLAGGVSGAGVVDDASELYRVAARRTVDALTDPSLAAALKRLIARFGHSAARVEALIAQLLPKREQWLRYFAFEGEAALRRALEDALARLVGEELERAVRRFPLEARGELAELVAHAAPSLGLNPSREIFDAFDVRDGGASVPLHARASAWRAAAELLLTKDGNWRRRADRRLGFNREHARERRRLVEVVESLVDDDALRDALDRVRRLPEPRYSDEQWRALADLRLVLRRAAAELRVVFAEREAVDFVEIALAAREALGSDDAPSDLLLALDYRIRHILVDEFQDTSHGQLRLLEILTAGWEPGDGRTLFLVGDPMQSIYRFRDADMSLFLKVRREGIGRIRCRALTLERNFRSAPAIIDWVNGTLSTAFPAADDIGRGEVRFTPCRAVRDFDGRVDVHVVRGGGEHADIDAAVDLVARERAADRSGTFAVLVQSRTHLGALHRRLRERGLPVVAVEIEPLYEQQIVQDLLGLTRALLHPADSIAWLGLLRAPWCGLRWKDLETIATLSRGRTIRDVIVDSETLERLTADGRARLERFAARLARVLDARADYDLAEWIERAWHALGGPVCVETHDDLRAADEVFGTLERLTRRGDLDDPASLESAFTAPRPEPVEGAAGAIEIMTIHRAKGLEFDTVVLLGLGRETRRDEQRALYWMERVAEDGREDLLLAPLPEPGGEDRLTALIREADEQRDAAERARLLYVAATRAKRRLHLVCRLDDDADAPPARSLLAPIWPALAVQVAPTRPAVAAEPEGIVRPVLRRLARIDDDASIVGPLGAAIARGDTGRGEATRPEFEWAGQPARQIGTVVHRRLQRIALDGLEAWSIEAVAASRADIRRELELLGLDRDEVDGAAEAVVDALAHVLADEKGRWILSAHDDAHSELELVIDVGGYVEHVRLDRTFVDRDGTRWIVDFKTGTHEGSDVDAFLDAEVERYRGQLERYARAIAAIDPRPIVAALYFPLLRAFRSWTPRVGATDVKASP